MGCATDRLPARDRCPPNPPYNVVLAVERIYSVVWGLANVGHTVPVAKAQGMVSLVECSCKLIQMAVCPISTSGRTRGERTGGQMKKRFCRLNRDGWYVSILDSQRGADQKESLAALLPNNRDRIYKTERMTTDGELVPCFRQRKSELRKGDRITLFHLMKGLSLPELAAAGGEGTDMMRPIKRRAVAQALVVSRWRPLLWWVHLDSCWKRCRFGYIR
jgi:hypothetical protein